MPDVVEWQRKEAETGAAEQQQAADGGLPAGPDRDPRGPCVTFAWQADREDAGGEGAEEAEQHRVVARVAERAVVAPVVDVVADVPVAAAHRQEQRDRGDQDRKRDPAGGAEDPTRGCRGGGEELGGAAAVGADQQDEGCGPAPVEKPDDGKLVERRAAGGGGGLSNDRHVRCRTYGIVHRRMASTATAQGTSDRPVPGPRSPRLPRAERRDQLLDSALKLISEEGYGGVTMEGVAREAAIAKTVVYDAFGSKRGLLQALFEREQQRVLAALADAVPTPPLSGDPAEILAGAITTALEAVRRYPQTWRLILVPADGTPPSLRAEVNRHRERLVRQVEPMIAWGTRRLGLGHLDPELSAHALIAAAEDAARLTLTHPRRFPPERMASYAADLVAAVGSSPGDDRSPAA
jgi:AcrR family transcriptional regulator